MKRRTVIRQLVVVAGGLALLPSCIGGSGNASVKLNNITISADQEKLLAEIAGTIIPDTDTPGARKLGVHLFVLKMLDDCYEKIDQQKFLKGLEQLEEQANQRFGSSFTAAATDQRQALISDIEAESSLTGEILDFYAIMKAKTLQGYLNSEYVMTRQLIYEMAPGRYNGYFPVKAS